jgi:hypothetical protein
MAGLTAVTVAWNAGNNSKDKHMKTQMERLTVSATYVFVLNGVESTGHVEFVARIKDSSKGLNLTGRAKRAAARRNNVTPSAINITGIVSW